MKTNSSSSMHSGVARTSRMAMAMLVPVAFTACTWFTDFKEQPSIEPWESMSQNPNDTTTPPRGQPAFSVPVQGTASPAFMFGTAPTLGVLDSMGTMLNNPIAVSDISLANGRLYYQINCAVCHGFAGDGEGAFKKVTGMALPPSLLTPLANGRSDGYLYGIIRNGRGAMPNYNRIEESDRWDVVNYVRALQGRTGSPADTTLAGLPGQTGNTVPGPSQTAPTKPAPFFRPSVVPTPGSPLINSATYKGATGSETSKEKHE